MGEHNDLTRDDYYLLYNLGNLYIADGYSVVRKVVVSTGIISTIAGSSSYGYSGDGGQATSAELTSPSGLTVDLSGIAILSALLLLFFDTIPFN